MACRPGVIFQRLLVVLRGSAVLAFRMIDGADVIQRVRIVRVQAQGHLIGLHGLVHREEVMIGDADLGPGERLAQLERVDTRLSLRRIPGAPCRGRPASPGRAHTYQETRGAAGEVGVLACWTWAVSCA